MRSDNLMSLLCVIPFFFKDKDQAVRLARWIADLGGVKNHDCLLVVDESTTAEGVYEPLSEAFKSVTVTTSKPEGEQGVWGTGTTNAEAANAMFRSGARYVYHKSKVPFFWMEPDAAPTRSTWLDEIESEYKACGKPFMGMRVDVPPHAPHMTGIGCYPFDVANHSLPMMDPFQRKEAWDYAGRKDTIGKGKAHFTDLIQHVYRLNGQEPEWPTFPTLESLSQINPEAAVFHRCKDSGLIDRLREKILGACVSQSTQEAGARDAIAQAPTEGSNPSAPTREGELLERIAKLEAMLASQTPATITDPPPPPSGRRKQKRTADQIAADKARMEQVRAARKPKMTGVL